MARSTSEGTITRLDRLVSWVINLRHLKKPISLVVVLVFASATFGYFLGHQKKSSSPEFSWPIVELSPELEEANVFLDVQLESARRENSYHSNTNNQPSLRQEIHRALKPIRLATEVQVLQVESVESGMRIENLSVHMRSGNGASLTLEARVFVPNTTSSPAILVLHGMNSSTEALLGDTDYHHGIGKKFADAGFLTIIPTRLSTKYDERYTLALKAMLLGTTLEGIEIQQFKALIDHIEEHRSFDGQLGVYGLSLGGYHGMLLAAIDTRVDAAYISGAVTDRFDLLLKRYPTPGTPASEKFSRSFWYGDFPLYFWKMDVLLDDVNLMAAIAPRPIAVETGQGDLLKLSGLDEVERRTREVYKNLGAEDQLSFFLHGGGHEADTTTTVEWFVEKLSLHADREESD